MANGLIELPSGDGFIIVEANVTKQSFWGPQCRELISRYIGRWMLDEGYAPWPDDMPPKFEVESFGDRRFRVKNGWRLNKALQLLQAFG